MYHSLGSFIKAVEVASMPVLLHFDHGLSQLQFNGKLVASADQHALLSRTIMILVWLRKKGTALGQVIKLSSFESFRAALSHQTWAVDKCMAIYMKTLN